MCQPCDKVLAVERPCVTRVVKEMIIISVAMAGERSVKVTKLTRSLF